MRLTIVGSGDALESGGRFNTCFRIETGEKTVFLDFGASSPVALKSHGIDANRADAIILSHLHGDHFGGLPFLLLDAQFLSRRDRRLVIAGPPGTRERVAALVEVFFPRAGGTKWRFPWQVIEIPSRGTSELLGLKITTTEVIHASGAPSTAVRISDGRRVLAYSGDTEWTDALIPIADGADLFIIECYEHARLVSGHITWKVLRTKLPDLRARRIMITHMNPSMLKKTKEAKDLGVLIAEDGLVMDI